MAVNLLFTVDVDNDGVEAGERTALKWTSLRMVPRIKQMCDGLGLRVTWFVRADNQLRDVYGTDAYLLLEHAALWSQMEGAGDEVGWHPHVYEWCEARGLYFNDTDEERCARKLAQTREELLAQKLRHASVRVGEAFHGNAPMHALDGLGLEVDATAIPGRVRRDESRSFDWGPTPNGPYHPSRRDYRVPGDGSSALRILEVPMTTMPVKASYDPEYMTRYVNPSYHHANFREGLERLLATEAFAGGGESFLTLILHTDEVNAEGRVHDLYSFSLDEVRKNVRHLLGAVEARGWEWRPLRMKDVPDVWAGAKAEGAGK